MKKHLFSALAVAVLGSVSVVQSATFLSISDNSASASAPWSIGVQFTVPADTLIRVTDIQYFNAKAGNTIREGLWASSTPNGSGNAIFSTTIVSSSGAGGFTSAGPITTWNNGALTGGLLGPGTYILAASGFTAANSFGDTTFGNTVPVYNNPSVLTGRTDIISFSSDPTFFNPANIGFSSTSGIERYKSVNFTYTAVPEPETYAMVAGAALVGFGLWRRRQSK